MGEQSLIDGIYFGLIIALVLYNLFWFIASKELTHLFFSLFLCANGGVVYLVGTQSQLLYLCTSMILIFGALFSATLLNIGNTNLAFWQKSVIARYWILGITTHIGVWLGWLGLAIIDTNTAQVLTVVSSTFLSGLIAYNYRSVQSLRLQAQHRSIEELRMSHDLQQAKSNFVATVGHELRGPVQAISHFVLSLKNSMPESAHQGLDKTDDNVETISELLDNMVKLSQSEWQATNLTLDKIHISELMSVMQAEFSVKAAEKDLQLQFEPTQCSLVSDKVCLSQILRNLIDNAIKYTDNGYVKVSVTEGADAACVTVEDTGCGMTSQQLPNIFKEFYQVRRTGRDRGVGLGLSIVERLTKQLGIDLTVSSKHLSGTTFELKIDKGASKATSENRKMHPASSSITTSLSDLDILIVSQENSAIAYLGDLVENWGGDVVRLNSFEDAFASADQGNPDPDLILADTIAYQTLTESLRTERLERFFAKDIPMLITNDGDLDDTLKERHTIIDASIAPMRLRSLIQRNVGTQTVSF